MCPEAIIPADIRMIKKILSLKVINRSLFTAKRATSIYKIRSVGIAVRRTFLVRRATFCNHSMRRIGRIGGLACATMSPSQKMRSKMRVISC